MDIMLDNSSVCKSCSRTFECKPSFLPICQSCSSRVVQHFFDSNPSPLNSILPSCSASNKIFNAAVTKVMQYNMLEPKQTYEVIENRKKENFEDDFYNFSVFGRNIDTRDSFFILDFSSFRLGVYSIDEMRFCTYKTLPNRFRGVESWSLVSTAKGFIVLCEDSNRKSRDRERIFYLFDKNFGFELIRFGLSPFTGNPTMCCVEDTVYMFIVNDNCYKFNCETKQWLQLLVQMAGLEQLNSLVVGSRILLTAANKSDISLYSIIGDYLNTFEDVFDKSVNQKILLFDGSKIFCLAGNQITTFDLAFKVVAQLRMDIERFQLVSSPVFYKQKFYMVSSKSKIFVFNSQTYKVEVINIEGDIKRLNFLENFK